MRFGEFTNAYHVMKISHDHLREQLATNQISLREALKMVRESLREHYKNGERGLTPQMSEELLGVLSYFCSIQGAGIYKTDATGSITVTPVALQGEMKELDKDDPLLRRAVASGMMISVRLESEDQQKRGESQASELLAVIPITDISGYLWGIIAVSQMPFAAFQEENLNFIRLLGAYTGDLLSQADNIFHDSSDTRSFISELENTWRMSKSCGISSSLIRISFPDATPREQYIAAIADRIRGLDYVWVFVDDKQRPVIYLLMTLMSDGEYDRYKQSLNILLRERFGQSVEEAGGTFSQLAVTGKRRLATYVNFVFDTLQESQRVSDPVIVATEAREGEDAPHANLLDTTVAAEQQGQADTELISQGSRRQPALAGKLDLAELTWLYRALIQADPQQLVAKVSLWSIASIQEVILQKFDRQVDHRLVGKMLLAMGFAAKNVLYTAIIKNPEIVLDWQVNVLPAILSQTRRAEASLYFVDEYPVPRKFQDELEKRGFPVGVPVKAANLVMLTAVHSQGDYYFTLSTEEELSPEMLCSFLEKLYRQIEMPLFIVMEKSPLHDTGEVTRFIEAQAGKIRFFYLPTTR